MGHQTTPRETAAAVAAEVGGYLAGQSTRAPSVQPHSPTEATTVTARVSMEEVAWMIYCLVEEEGALTRMKTMMRF
jgi:hypothetical protein